jgi:hypothetical protein
VLAYILCSYRAVREREAEESALLAAHAEAEAAGDAALMGEVEDRLARLHGGCQLRGTELADNEHAGAAQPMPVYRASVWAPYAQSSPC